MIVYFLKVRLYISHGIWKQQTLVVEFHTGCYHFINEDLCARSAYHGQGQVIISHRSLTHWGWDKMAAIFPMTFSNAFSWMKITIKISLKFVPKGPINNIPALVQIMAWRRPGDKPLSEPMLVSLLTYIMAVLNINLSPGGPVTNKH